MDILKAEIAKKRKQLEEKELLVHLSNSDKMYIPLFLNILGFSKEVLQTWGSHC